MSRVQTVALFVLTLSAPALADTIVLEGVKLRVCEPVGNGDPNAISCWARRVTPPIRGLQCARKSDWARLNGSAGRSGASNSGILGPPSADQVPINANDAQVVGR
jgi:hypothetical protein